MFDPNYIDPTVFVIALLTEISVGGLYYIIERIKNGRSDRRK